MIWYGCQLFLCYSSWSVDIYSLSYLSYFSLRLALHLICMCLFVCWHVPLSALALTLTTLWWDLSLFPCLCGMGVWSMSTWLGWPHMLSSKIVCSELNCFFKKNSTPNSSCCPLHVPCSFYRQHKQTCSSFTSFVSSGFCCAPLPEVKHDGAPCPPLPEGILGCKDDGKACPPLPEGILGCKDDGKASPPLPEGILGCIHDVKAFPPLPEGILGCKDDWTSCPPLPEGILGCKHDGTWPPLPEGMLGSTPITPAWGAQHGRDLHIDAHTLVTQSRTPNKHRCEHGMGTQLCCQPSTNRFMMWAFCFLEYTSPHNLSGRQW